MRHHGLQPGSWVRSTYRNRWLGQVLELRPAANGVPELALCKPLRSAKGNPLRKVKPRWLNPYYLQQVPAPVEALPGTA